MSKIINSCDKGDIETFKKLFSENEDKEKLLILACDKGNLEIVIFLTDNKADIHIENDEPLRIAVNKAHTEIVEYLIKKGANVNADKYILSWACETEQVKVVKLVDNGADFSDGWPLKFACIVGNKEIVNYLIEKGANVQAQNNGALVVACYNGRTEIVKILIENGADINAKNDMLYYLQNSDNREEIMKLLKENKLKIYN